MNRSLERFALLAGVIILLCSAQFGACLAGGPVALPVALLLSVGVTLLWAHFDLSSDRPWLPPLVCAGAVLLSVLLAEFSFRSDFAEWFSFLFAAAGSGLTMFVLLRSRVRCALCNRRLATQALSFKCPRCHMQVCDEACWSFEHRRCTLCLEQRVPVLPTGEKWWTRVAGPRSTYGRCQICLGSAEQVDLRICPHCRRPQCRECWDFNNGECQRCGTALPDLPASLTMTVVQTTENIEIHGA